MKPTAQKWPFLDFDDQIRTFPAVQPTAVSDAGASRASVAGTGDGDTTSGKASGVGSLVDGRRVVDLTTLSATQGFIIQGETGRGEAGYSVSAAGDVNGDGFEDVIVGAHRGGDYSGRAYVIFGTDQGFGSLVDGRRVLDLASLSPAQGFLIQGDEASDLAGSSVSSAGDVNGDGFGDMIVGARYGDDGGDSAGEAYVIFGTDQGFGSLVDGRSVLDLTTLSAAQGFIIQGDAALAAAGFSVSSAGDVNGDGFGDLIVGAPNGNDGGDKAGEAYVVFGTASGFGSLVDGRSVLDLTTLSAAEGFIIQGDAAGDYAGFAVSSAGDVNGDGFGDMIVGAPNGDDGGNTAGEAYVLFGKASGFGSLVDGRRVVDLTKLSAAQGFVVQGDAKFDGTGVSVSTAGDVNGDGFEDMIVGASNGGNSGEAYVLFGKDSGFGKLVDGRRVVDLAKLSAAQGFVVQGDADFDAAGRSVSSAGDVNGDGFEDLIVGARFGDDGGLDAGEAYVVFGKASGFGKLVDGHRVVDLAKLSPSQGFVVQGDAAGDYAGKSVSAAGDINGDGFDDLIVGAPRGDDGGDDNGEAYVLFGGRFGSSTKAVVTTGSKADEILRGNAGNDVLTGKGGEDVFRSGAGNDRISIADGDVFVIDAGSGNTDIVVFDGKGINLDARNFANSALVGIEAFDITGSGKNSLTLDAFDVFNFATTGGNADFTGAESERNLVVLGNGGDVLTLGHAGLPDDSWSLVLEDKALNATDSGGFDIYNLVDGDGDVLASVAVDADVGVTLI